MLNSWHILALEFLKLQSYNDLSDSKRTKTTIIGKGIWWRKIKDHMHFI